MPYKIFKMGDDGTECVHKLNNGQKGDKKHCYSGSDAHKKALAYMRALYRAEGETKEIETIDKELSDLGLDTKEIESMTEKCYGEMASVGMWVPWGIKSFAELSAWQKSQEVSKEISDNTYAFTRMVTNIMDQYDVGMNEKMAAIKELADEFSGLTESTMMEVDEEEEEDKEKAEATHETFSVESVVERVLGKVKELFGIKPKETDQSGFMVYKEADGSYRWLARYSNNFRDQDDPPEIISAKSHQKFVEKVEKGLAPLPELWIWHVKEWRIGAADWVTYDPTGFAVAGGHADPGMESVFDHMATKEFRVSHGMLKSTVVRDPADKSIIIEHETREISPLPPWAAANKLTGFVVLDTDSNKEVTMAIPADKKETLKKEFGFSDDLLALIEAQNTKDAEKAINEGLEHKEAEQSVSELAETPPAAVEIPAPVPDLAAQLQAVLAPLTERLTALEGSIKELKQKETAEQANVAKALRDTPAAAILSMFEKSRSVVGSDATRVDGRTELAKQRPAEAPANVEGRTLVPFINDILAGKPGQQA